MRMTDLTIGEYYAWKGKRINLLATGVVLKNYQHKGVQIELIDEGPWKHYVIPAREITSTWEDFLIARAEWDHDEQIKRDQLHQMHAAADELRKAMRELDLYDPRQVTLNAYHGYIMLNFHSAKQADKLTHVLQTAGE